MTDIEILDLWSHSTAKPSLVFPKFDGVFFVDSLNWSSRSILEYAASRHLSFACTPVTAEPPLKRQIDLASLSFR